MRLVCPSCAAEYEIDDAAIGARGRMVRCASCAAEWFQAPPAAAEAVAPPAAPPVVSEPAAAPEIEAPQVAPEPEPQTKAVVEAAPEPEPVAQATPSSGSSMAALSALREGLKDPPPEEPPFEIEDHVDPQSDAERIQFDEAPGVVEGDIVIEEQPPQNERQAEAARLAASLRETEADSGSGGGGAFLAGFATVTLLSLIAIAAYVKAPDIAEVLPAAAGPLAGYADAVDQGRLAIAAFIRG